VAINTIISNNPIDTLRTESYMALYERLPVVKGLIKCLYQFDFTHVVIYLQIELRIVIIWKGIILNKGSSFPFLRFVCLLIVLYINCYQFKYFFHRYIQLYLIVNYLPHLCHLLIIQKHIFFLNILIIHECIFPKVKCKHGFLFCGNYILKYW
jgi:hypothetical protein